MTNDKYTVRPRSLRWQSRRGSVVIAMLIIALVIISTVTLYLRNAVQEMKYSERTFALQQSINLAEMGAEEALYALNNEDWSSWTELANDRYYRAYSPNSGSDKVYVYVDAQTTSNVWLATGSEVDVSNGSVEKQLYIRLGYRSMFANGLTAKNQVLMNGNQISVDSYFSTSGAYNATTNVNDGGSVASASVEVSSVVLQNADVLGYVSTGGAYPEVGSQGSITGYDTPSGTKIDDSRVAQDFYAEFPNVSQPDTSSAYTSLSGPFVGIAGFETTYHFHDLYIGSKGTLYVYGDVNLVLDDDIKVRGEIVVMPGASLKLYIGDEADIGGNGVLNINGVPEDLQIYGTATNEQEIYLHGNGALSGIIYAPNAELALKGGGSSGVFYGAAVADTIELKGNYEFHYDESLKDFSPDETYQMLEWRELTAATDRYPLKTPSSLTTYTP
ncbi:DUF7305 domain-containing protein [Cerasicoccus maritimus]|uniref:DUF7305 domain-containing protein n=1 Tax=Cerasicoccus maritimus TaxID=490089 RepID=UPI0028527321|nr:hypothetical protein [Cerasicoccus maritimus]